MLGGKRLKEKCGDRGIGHKTWGDMYCEMKTNAVIDEEEPALGCGGSLKGGALTLVSLLVPSFL